MANKVKIERHGAQLRIIFEEPSPDGPHQEGVTVTVARHWDLPIVDALQVAAAITHECAQLLVALTRARPRTDLEDKAQNGAPRSPMPSADPLPTPAEPAHG